MGHKKGSTDEVSDVVMREYESREFCKSTQCPVQLELDTASRGSPEYDRIKAYCRRDCHYDWIKFQGWLSDNGYAIDGDTPESVFSGSTAYEYHQWLTETGQRIVRRS